jgi:hypothetical protein
VTHPILYFTALATITLGYQKYPEINPSKIPSLKGPSDNTHVKVGGVLVFNPGFIKYIGV